MELQGLDYNENETKEMINLYSRDGKVLEVEKKVLKDSAMLSSMLDMDKTSLDMNVDVDYDILVKIVEYLTFHLSDKEVKVIEKPIKNKKNLEEFLCEWDAEFVRKMTLEELLQLLPSVNYFDIEQMKCVIAATIAFNMRNFPDEKIKQIIKETV
jgi:hypothetical protein